MTMFEGDLPSYSQSVPVPSYSLQPGCGEQVLQQTPSRAAAHSVPTGTFMKRSQKTTIIISEQESDASLPTFGRLARLQGALLLDESELVTQVVFEIEAKVETTISDGGAKTTPLYHQKHILWSRAHASTSTSNETCPSQFQLDYPLPSTYQDGDSDKPLPPSFSGFFNGSPTVYAKTIYQLRVCTTRLVTSKIGFWTKTRIIRVPFNYYPRTRASRPIVPRPRLFSSIKTSPEEWYQASSSLKPRSNSTLQPLPVHLFVPAGRVYSLSDTIPFHLQISGPTSSLQTVFSSSSADLNRVASCDSQNTVASHPLSKSSPGSVPQIRVYLMRQLSVEVRGGRSWRNTVIGQGSLSPVPPLSTSHSTTPSSEEHLDWEGTLKCDESVRVGGFFVANVHVKDFVMLSITPSLPHKTQVLELTLSVPIRLVTDSCEGELPDSAWDSDPTQ